MSSQTYFCTLIFEDNNQTTPHHHKEFPKRIKFNKRVIIVKKLCGTITSQTSFKQHWSPKKIQNLTKLIILFHFISTWKIHRLRNSLNIIINTILTAINRDPSLFHDRALIVYKLCISLGLDSSHWLLLGLQLNTRSLSKLPTTIDWPLGLDTATVNSFSSSSFE